MVLSVSLQNVRSYQLFNCEFDPHVTLILGSNGSGKTTLLEAVYVALRGTSFRGRDRELINHDQTSAVMKLVADHERRVRLSQNGEAKVAKEFTIEGRKTARLPAKYRFPVVLFEPEELRMLSSSPQRRRDFIDGVLAHLYPSYATTLNRYNRVLLQRNELLKQRETMSASAWDNHLFAWDVKFAELATTITNERQKFIELSNTRLSDIYSNIAAKEHAVIVRYVSKSPVQNYSEKLFAILQSSRHEDALRGFTSSGPHRDDIEILLDGYPASETASRGEMRTIMLAYKLLEVTLQQEMTGKLPVILMDDVFSELDITREQKLMQALLPYQTIITATDLRDELKINAKIIKL